MSYYINFIHNLLNGENVYLKNECEGRLIVVNLWRLHIEFTLKKPPISVNKLSRYQLHLKYFDDLDIKCGDKVIDIGCGSFPLPLATLVIDRYIQSDKDRPGQKLVTLNKPLIVSDVNYIPFKDKSFDFVYCSNVLEHLDDPINACKEIQRIGKKGYIETPYRIADVLHNYLYLHKWSVSHSGNTLIFCEYEEWEKKGTDTNIFIKLGLSNNENYYRFWENKNYKFLYNSFYWQDKFNCVVIRRDGSIEKFEPDKDMFNQETGV